MHTHIIRKGVLTDDGCISDDLKKVNTYSGFSHSAIRFAPVAGASGALGGVVAVYQAFETVAPIAVRLCCIPV